MKRRKERVQSRWHQGLHEALAREAKAMVAVAFRNGPIEGVHARKLCPVCTGKSEYSHISDGKMKQFMTDAVNRVFTLLVLRKENPRRTRRYWILAGCSPVRGTIRS